MRKYYIEVVDVKGKWVFNTLTEANEFYGERYDYLNYALNQYEKYKHRLTEKGIISIRLIENM